MHSSTRTALLLVILLLTCGPVLGQRVIDVQPDGVAKPSGWVIPNLHKLRRRGRVPVMPVGPEGKHTLYASEIEPPKNRAILLEDAAYYRVENGRRDLIESPIEAESLARLDVDGKVFAYIAFGAGIGLTESQRRPGELVYISMGCVMGYAYYDLDGDGKFELLTRSDRWPGTKVFIPAWVLRDAKPAAR
jgi:hypothetical protein